MKPKVAMIGDGNVGTALGDGLRGAGYEVRATGRDPAKVRELAAWGDVVFFAVPYEARRDAVDEAGKETLEGKVVVDVTNAVTKPNYEFEIDPTEGSGAEGLQRMAPGARVVKAFNTVFADHMATGKVKGEPVSLFVAGDDEAAKATVRDMGRAIGFDPVDAGPLTNARWMETLGMFNMQLGSQQGREIGFRLVR